MSTSSLVGGVSGSGDKEKLEEGNGIAEHRLSWGDALCWPCGDGWLVGGRVASSCPLH